MPWTEGETIEADEMAALIEDFGESASASLRRGVLSQLNRWYPVRPVGLDAVLNSMHYEELAEFSDRVFADPVYDRAATIAYMEGLIAPTLRR